MDLPGAMVREIARRLLPSRRAIDAMRGACRSWRAAIPPTRGPWLVLSSTRADEDMETLEINAAGVLSPFDCFSPPPPGIVCWGCCVDLISIRHLADNRLSMLCLVCGKEKHVAELPDGRTPKAVFKIPGITCALTDPNSEMFWSRAFVTPPVWNPMLQLAGRSARSVTDFNGILYMAAFPDVLIVDRVAYMRFDDQAADGEHLQEAFELHEIAGIDVDGVHLQEPFELHEIPEIDVDDEDLHEPFELEVDVEDLDEPLEDVVELHIPLDLESGMQPWLHRGHHLFDMGGEVFLCVLIRDMDNSNKVMIKLFVLERDDHGHYSITSRNDIGHNCLFLGSNRAFSVPSRPPYVKNRAYIVDDDGLTPSPRLLVIDIQTQQVQTIPYPPGIGDTPNWAPGTWVAPPVEAAALGWHCA